LFLTKHHDGFCLWDTKTTERKVTKSPLGEDVLAKVRSSCDKHGLKLALYFSEGEWGGPDKPGGGRLPGDGGYDPEKKKRQLHELLTQYGPIEFFWMDHAVGDGGLGHQETVEWVRRFQSGCFVGFNSGVSAGDLRLGEMGHASALDDVSGVGLHANVMQGYAGFRLAEFTYPIWPDSVPKGTHTHWFYSYVADTKGTCHTPEKIRYWTGCWTRPFGPVSLPTRFGRIMRANARRSLRCSSGCAPTALGCICWPNWPTSSNT
jgi:alpha-L-fucosidase